MVLNVGLFRSNMFIKWLQLKCKCYLFFIFLRRWNVNVEIDKLKYNKNISLNEKIYLKVGWLLLMKIKGVTIVSKI